MEGIYQYKGKPYAFHSKTKIKINGERIDGVIYLCLYENPDGMIWVRTEEEFFRFFKKTENG